MTQNTTTAVPSPPDAAADVRPPETFAAVTLRRLRYVVAIGVSAALFYYVGGLVVHPPADSFGNSLLWHGPGVFGGLVVLVLTLVTLAASMVMCHPDAPFVGLWCSLLGLGSLAIRGGNITQMLSQAQTAGKVPDLYHTLAGECVLWLLIVVAADFTSRLLWLKFFANTTWIGRHGLNPSLAAGRDFGMPAASESSARPAKRTQQFWIDTLLAFALTGCIAYVLMTLLVQSQDKGQVLVGIFVSFAVGALVARWICPECDALALWAAVPAAAAVGYLLTRSTVAVHDGTMTLDSKPALNVYLGQALSAVGRGLPIDFVVAGVPGAILGYYTAVRLHLAHQGEKAAAAEANRGS